MRLLLAEDDPHLSASVARGLRDSAYAVDVIADGRTALTESLVVEYDVVILDVMLPSMTGYEVASAIRSRGSSVPILMLTARDAVQDRIAGLDAGADDYLVKPFAFGELLARIRALLRRGPHVTSSVFTVADLEVDTRQHSVLRGGRPLPLTMKEYTLLEYLIRQQGRVVSRTEIATHVWDDNHDPMSNNIDVLVTRLRRKVDGGFDLPLIHTRRGAGYMLAPSDDSA